MYGLLLSKENLALSLWEALLLLEVKKGDYELHDNFLAIKKITPKNAAKIKRLAFTRKVYHILFSCKESELIKKLQQFEFGSIYQKDFALRILSLRNPVKYKEAVLAGYVWKSVKNPKVNLSSPTTKIELVFSDRVYCCLELYENHEPFYERRSHLRPEPHPTSLSPKFARGLVNMANSSFILDPFCGAGGILIEAGLMGLRAEGGDLDELMVRRAEQNLKQFRLKTVKVQRRDALALQKRVPAVVTDLPYGKSSKVEGNLRLLYGQFLKKYKKITKRMVVIFPDFVKHQDLIAKHGWKVLKEFSLYVHRSLTRKIYVLEA